MSPFNDIQCRNGNMIRAFKRINLGQCVKTKEILLLTMEEGKSFFLRKGYRKCERFQNYTDNSPILSVTLTFIPEHWPQIPL